MCDVMDQVNGKKNLEIIDFNPDTANNKKKIKKLRIHWSTWVSIPKFIEERKHIARKLSKIKQVKQLTGLEHH